MTKFIEYEYLCTNCAATTTLSTVQDMYEHDCECGHAMTLLSVSDNHV